MMLSNLVLVWFSSLLFWLAPVAARAEMLNDPQDLLKSHFPGADIENQNVLLTPEEAQKVQAAVGAPVGDKVYVFFVAKRRDRIVGYAGLTTRKVRSKDQTALYFVSPAGKLESIELVAFYEPPEYRPKKEWLDGFAGQQDPKTMKLGGQVRALSGATLTAQSFMDSAKIILAVWRERFASRAGAK